MFDLLVSMLSHGKCPYTKQEGKGCRSREKGKNRYVPGAAQRLTALSVVISEHW